MPLLERHRVPVHQNLLARSREEARGITRGELRLAACGECTFVTNTAFDAALLSYGAAYENDQTSSAVFGSYVDGLVDRMLAQGLAGKRVVEIGCGKGYFLRRLCERGGNSGVGFDSTYAGPDADLGGRLRFVRGYYEAGPLNGGADAFVCRHVIEHVPDPLRLLRTIREGLGGEEGAKAYLETPEIKWILRNTVIQDFFYEHCSYFSDESLAAALAQAGLAPSYMAHVFDGQYLWCEAVTAAAAESTGRRAGAPEFLQLLEGYARREKQALERNGEDLARRGREGPVAVWGAGAKGVTFLNLLDPEARIVDCVIDVNPRKRGCFLPGTGHPILPPEALAGRDVRQVVVMNPNYVGEIQAAIAQLGLSARVRAEVCS